MGNSQEIIIGIVVSSFDDLRTLIIVSSNNKSIPVPGKARILKEVKRRS